MHKAISCILIIIVIYSIMKIRNGGQDPIFSKDENQSNYVEGDNPPEYLPNENSMKMEGSFLQKTLSMVMINVLKTEKGRILMERMIQPANTPLVDKDYSLRVNNMSIIDAMFHIKTTKEGAGSRFAICGHAVNVTYRVINMHDRVLESGKKTMRLGQASIFSAADNIIAGMKVGETRTAIISDKLAYEEPGFMGKKPANPTRDYKLEVTLDSIASEIFIDDMVKVFDNEISFKKPILCGSKISFDAKIMGIDGRVIFDSRESNKLINIKLGDLTYPVIFSYGLFNKQDIGTRTVIFGGKYLRSFLDKDHSAIFPEMQPDIDQFYMVEFSNVSIN